MLCRHGNSCPQSSETPDNMTQHLSDDDTGPTPKPCACFSVQQFRGF